MKSKSELGSRSRKTDIGKPEPSRQTQDFSHPLAVDEIPDAGLDISLRADAGECAAIARRCGLVAVANLEADLIATRLARGSVNVRGVTRARVTQTCVVSLDPFEIEVRVDIDLDFAPPAEAARAFGDAAAELDVGSASAEAFGVKRDPPDPILDGRIDLGGLVEEFLILSLDPHPRKPGARFGEAGVSGDPVENASPFAALKKLKGEA